MDNFKIDMIAEGREHLSDILKLVFKIRYCDGKDNKGNRLGVTHYAIRERKEGVKSEKGGWNYGCEPKSLRLIFFKHYTPPNSTDKIAFPFKMSSEGAADFTNRWLEEADYGGEPDMDGDCGKGWRVYNEAWGHVDSDHSAVIAISPSWSMYGK